LHAGKTSQNNIKLLAFFDLVEDESLSSKTSF